MMNRDFVSVLDECLARVKAGELPETCLADYPEHASQLAPLLETFLAVQVLRPVPAPAPDAVLSGRQRFLAEAARLRQAELAPRPEPQSRVAEWLRQLWQPAAPQRLAWAAVTAIAALLVFILVGGSIVVASEDSLPGDPLYPVKRIVETVQLNLTLDPGAHEKLEQILRERRRQEIQELVDRRREAQVTIEGVIQSIHSATWIIAGYPQINIDEQTVIEGNAGVGALVRIQARSESSGYLRALRVQVLVPASAPSPTLSLMATVIPSLTLTPELALPAAIVQDTATPVPSTATITPTRTPLSLTQTPSPTAMVTESPTPTVIPSATAVPAVPRPVRWTGCIEARASAWVWIIAGREVVLSSETAIRGNLVVGQRAEVIATHEGDRYLALSIEVLGEEQFEFSGVIQDIGPTAWTIGGIKVAVDPEQTRITPGPPNTTGGYAHVTALRRCTGLPLALSINLRMTTIMSGVVQNIAGNRWVIDGVEFIVNSDTQLQGNPGVGSRVEVVAALEPGGPPIALRITVLPTRTPTPRPAASLTPTSVPTDMQTPTPVGTSTPLATIIATSTVAPATGTPQVPFERASPTPSLLY